MASNAHILQDGMAKYHKRILDEVEKRCRDFCEELCQEAVHARESAPGKHDFTGNMMNSIVVCLFKLGTPREAWYSQDIVKPSVSRKMSTPSHYVFKHDYQDEISSYVPQIATDKGWGEQDAINFFRSYRPKGRNAFDIVVAYTVEYADWVEKERHTTGFLRTYDYANTTGVTFLRLPMASKG